MKPFAALWSVLIQKPKKIFDSTNEFENTFLLMRFLTQTTAVVERLVHQLSTEVNLHVNICI